MDETRFSLPALTAPSTLFTQQWRHVANIMQTKPPGNLPKRAWNNFPKRQRKIRGNLRVHHLKKELPKIESWDCTHLCIFLCQCNWLWSLLYNTTLTYSRPILQTHEVKDTEDRHYFFEGGGQIAQHQGNGECWRYDPRLEQSFTFRKAQRGLFQHFCWRNR